MDIFIISGLSGGGKSRVAAALEDLDFYCVDNMPVSMMSKFAELCVATHGRYERVALVTDVRALEDINEFFETLDEIRKMGINLNILFVEAEIETIVKRYKETRRRHPLIASGTEHINLQDAVLQEAQFLAPLRLMADEIIDTTGLTLNRLQQRLVNKFMEGQEYKALNINVKSFGFKHGLPIEADLIFDVRFMPNPHYERDLREKTGLDADVRNFVFAHTQSEGFFKRLCDMMDFLLPHYMEEGKRYLIVCIGCTGGKHRSVAISHALAEHLSASGYPVDCIHRDIEKE